MTIKTGNDHIYESTGNLIKITDSEVDGAENFKFQGWLRVFGEFFFSLKKLYNLFAFP